MAPVRVAAGVVVLALAGCSAVENFVAGDKVDYRSASVKTTGLDVPPDLTQLARDSRYQQPSGGAISAAAFQSGAAAATSVAPATGGVVAPNAVGDLRIQRLGNERWLSTGLTAEQLWPQLEAFWKERGLTLVVDQPAAGVMETDWAENRAKLPNDFIRKTLGSVLDSAYSTGELDKYRTRIERTATGTDVFITHRGMVETYTGERKETTVWQPRPTDPQLEGEFLSRLMIKLGAKEETAKLATTVPGTPATTVTAAGAPRARLLADRPTASLQVDDGFDRAWRRVGVALDRSGFTVEDRDRSQGVYFVRYVDPAFAGKEEPNFFSKLFSFGKKDDAGGPARYRVVVKAEGEVSTVTVLDSKGAPENGDAGKRITALLLDELK